MVLFILTLTSFYIFPYLRTKHNFAKKKKIKYSLLLLKYKNSFK